LLFNSFHFFWRSLPVFPRLIDDGSGQQLRRIEFANRKPVEPAFAAAGVALDPSAADVPSRDLDAVGPALAEQENGQGGVW